MGDFTTESFAQRALSLNLLSQKDLQSVWEHLGTRDVELSQLIKLLERRGLMTNYQVERLLKGEPAGFFYGDYKVLYFVGKGTFARVYRAVHKDSGQVVALKVLRKKQSEKQSDRDRFIREGEMGLKLRHPNIVPIYETYSKGRVHFFAMEFVEGQSLRDFLRIRRKLEPLEAAQIMDGVVAGVSHAFEKGVSHRDLKLSNVLISSNGHPKLADFGLANMENDSGGSQNYTNTRTIDYANLEKLSGVEKGDRRSDIFFLGCVFYNLLAGEPPHEDTRDRVKRMESSRLKNVIPLRDHLPDVPREIEAIVNKAMSIDASKRYQKPVEMLVDLRKCIKALKAAEAGVVEEKAREGEGKTVMLIESTAALQDALRTALKKQGYRVLVIGDAERGYQRVAKDPKVADCVVVSTVSLGRDGLEVFQKLSTESATEHIPLILLLGKKQEKLLKKVKTAEHHRTAVMPIKLKGLRQDLRELLDAAKRMA